MMSTMDVMDTPVGAIVAVKANEISALQNIKRSIRLSCMTCSSHYLVIGAQTGSIYFFERSTLKFLQLVTFDDFQEPLSHLVFSPDEKILAIATGHPHRNIYVTSVPIKFKRKKDLMCISDHKSEIRGLFASPHPSLGNKIQLFSCDDSGLVCKTTVDPIALTKPGFSSIIGIGAQTATEMLFEGDSRISQLSFDLESQQLLVSSLTCVTVLDFVKSQALKIGTKSRQGLFGASHFKAVAGVAEQAGWMILSARPGQRLWISTLDNPSKVTQTLNFQTSFNTVLPLFLFGSQDVWSASTQDGKSYSSDDTNFQKIIPFNECLVLAYSSQFVFLVDIHQLKIINWYYLGPKTFGSIAEVAVSPPNKAYLLFHKVDGNDLSNNQTIPMLAELSVDWNAMMVDAAQSQAWNRVGYILEKYLVDDLTMLTRLESLLLSASPPLDGNLNVELSKLIKLRRDAITTQTATHMPTSLASSSANIPPISQPQQSSSGSLAQKSNQNSTINSAVTSTVNSTSNSFAELPAFVPGNASEEQATKEVYQPSSTNNTNDRTENDTDKTTTPNVELSDPETCSPTSPPINVPVRSSSSNQFNTSQEYSSSQGTPSEIPQVGGTTPDSMSEVFNFTSLQKFLVPTPSSSFASSSQTTPLTQSQTMEKPISSSSSSLNDNIPTQQNITDTSSPFNSRSASTSSIAIEGITPSTKTPSPVPSPIAIAQQQTFVSSSPQLPHYQPNGGHVLSSSSSTIVADLAEAPPASSVSHNSNTPELGASSNPPAKKRKKPRQVDIGRAISPSASLASVATTSSTTPTSSYDQMNSFGFDSNKSAGVVKAPVFGSQSWSDSIYEFSTPSNIQGSQTNLSNSTPISQWSTPSTPPVTPKDPSAAAPSTQHSTIGAGTTPTSSSTIGGVSLNTATQELKQMGRDIKNRAKEAKEGIKGFLAVAGLASAAPTSNTHLVSNQSATHTTNTLSSHTLATTVSADQTPHQTPVPTPVPTPTPQSLTVAPFVPPTTVHEDSLTRKTLEKLLMVRNKLRAREPITAASIYPSLKLWTVHYHTYLESLPNASQNPMICELLTACFEFQVSSPKIQISEDDFAPVDALNSNKAENSGSVHTESSTNPSPHHQIDNLKWTWKIALKVVQLFYSSLNLNEVIVLSSNRKWDQVIEYILIREKDEYIEWKSHQAEKESEPSVANVVVSSSRPNLASRLNDMKEIDDWIETGDITSALNKLVMRNDLVLSLAYLQSLWKIGAKETCSYCASLYPVIQPSYIEALLEQERETQDLENSNTDPKEARSNDGAIARHKEIELHYYKTLISSKEEYIRDKKLVSKWLDLYLELEMQANFDALFLPIPQLRYFTLLPKFSVFKTLKGLKSSDSNLVCVPKLSNGKDTVKFRDQELIQKIITSNPKSSRWKYNIAIQLVQSGCFELGMNLLFGFRAYDIVLEVALEFDHLPYFTRLLSVDGSISSNLWPLIVKKKASIINRYAELQKGSNLTENLPLQISPDLILSNLSATMGSACAVSILNGENISSTSTALNSLPPSSLQGVAASVVPMDLLLEQLSPQTFHQILMDGKANISKKSLLQKSLNSFDQYLWSKRTVFYPQQISRIENLEKLYFTNPTSTFNLHFAATNNSSLSLSSTASNPAGATATTTTLKQSDGSIKPDASNSSPFSDDASALRDAPFFTLRHTANGHEWDLTFVKSQSSQTFYGDQSGHWGLRLNLRDQLCSRCGLPLLDQRAGKVAIFEACHHTYHEMCVEEDACPVCLDLNFGSLIPHSIHQHDSLIQRMK